MMKYISALIFYLSFNFAAAEAVEVNEQLLSFHFEELQKLQSENGAFYPTNCLNKQMTRNCYLDKSLFFTGLISESLDEHNLEIGRKIKDKSFEYLAHQFKEQKGILRYYQKDSKVYGIVKPDVDDNGIVLSLLLKNSNLATKAQVMKNIRDVFENSKITHTIYRKGSKKRESYTGEYLSTWIKPSDPFFNDVDLVVNFNGLLTFFEYNKLAPEQERINLQPICNTVNKIIDWSVENNFDDLMSIRHWTLRKKANYSQWYPSKFAVIQALVRAHLSGGDASCLTPAYRKVRKYLIAHEEFTGNLYDQILGVSSYARILAHEKLPKDSLIDPIKKIHTMLEAGKYGKEPFFFYGAVGYVGATALVRTLLIETLAIYLHKDRTPASTDIQEKAFLDSLLAEQMEDGSFTALILPSSPLYNIYVIFLYEYLGIIEQKKEITKALMEHIFSQQKKNGALAGYPEGPDHYGISFSSYMAGKMAGYDENDPRMKKLENLLNDPKFKQRPDMLTIPFMMLFSLSPVNSTFNTGVDKILLKNGESIPWIKVLLNPVLFMLDNGHSRILTVEKYPQKVVKTPYEEYVKRKRTPVKNKDSDFVDWAMKNINPDGTFFDYTPTTVPMLMALSAFEAQKKILEKGIASLEDFQIKTPEGHLLQTPGEASIGETFYIANVLLDVGMDANHPSVVRAEKYLTDHQLASGGWGFSKNSLHFADSDDTSNAMYLLIRLDQARGKKIRPEVFRALDWLVTLQNKDGGFGTWERTKGLFGELINRVANKRGLVMSESVFEHTARIIVCLSYLRGQNLKARSSYDKAFKWLLKQQKKDGSFAGTWFINYMFSTSMAMTALGTEDSKKSERAIKKAINYLQHAQMHDGGFGESPESFIQEHAVPLDRSSYAQTGLIVSQLLTLDAKTQCKYHSKMKGILNTSHLYLRDEKQNWVREMDQTWTAVTFPKVEYLIYPYIQRMVPWQAYNMHLTSACR